MPETLVIRPKPAGGDLDAITDRLGDAFGSIREGLDAGRPVIVVLDDRDLLGQGEVLDAAVATGLLGMVRAFAIEGAKPGWRVNAVAHRDVGEELEATIEWLSAAPGLSGQLIRTGTDHLGKVLP